MRKFSKEATTNETRWILPPHQLPAGLKILPILLWLIILGILGWAVFWHIIPAFQGDSKTVDIIFDLIFSIAFPIIFLFPLFAGARFTSLWILGRSEIEVTRDDLLVSNRFGPFGKRTRISISAIDDVTIVGVDENESVSIAWLEKLCLLRFGNGDQEPLDGALGYTKEVLQPLAAELLEKLQNQNSKLVSKSVGFESQVVEPFADQKPDWAKESDEEDARILGGSVPDRIEVLDFQKRLMYVSASLRLSF